MSDKQPIITSQPGSKQGEYEKLESSYQPTETATGEAYANFGVETALLTTSVGGKRTWTSGLFDCMQDTKNCKLNCIMIYIQFELA